MWDFVLHNFHCGVPLIYLCRIPTKMQEMVSRIGRLESLLSSLNRQLDVIREKAGDETKEAFKDVRAWHKLVYKFWNGVRDR